KYMGIVIALNLFIAIIPKHAADQRGEVSFQVFYEELSPYGQWVRDANYQYIWIPDVDQNFEPYSTNGHWVYTNYGWTWVSNYPWGWAPFHYGRWDYNDYYGWFWVPDNEWGPAWVCWRRVNGYYGWAPLTPGISISLSFGRGFSISASRWIFVRDRDIYRNDIHNYYIDRRQNNDFMRRSTVINKTYVDQSRHSTYIYGPERDEVQRVSGKRISPVAIQGYDRPGQNLSNNRMQIYRPVLKQKEGSAPARFVNRTDVKPVKERNYSNQGRTSPSGHTNIIKEKAQIQQPNTVRPNTGNKSGTDTRYQRNVTTPSKNYSTPRQDKAPVDKSNLRNRTTQPGSVNPTNVTPVQRKTATPTQNTTPSNRGAIRGRQPQQQRPVTTPEQRKTVTPTQNATPSNSGAIRGRQPQQQRNVTTPEQRKTATPTQNTKPSNREAIKERQPREQNIIRNPKENKPAEPNRKDNQENRRRE
ncbi:MAG: hypothetical protein Q8859_03430, partial [Bacteroidota bacterium]|nr:hypothetical protein [Bacteroidota bacterium]